jgi:hypothetical protein
MRRCGWRPDLAARGGGLRLLAPQQGFPQRLPPRRALCKVDNLNNQRGNSNERSKQTYRTHGSRGRDDGGRLLVMITPKQVKALNEAVNMACHWKGGTQGARRLHPTVQGGAQGGQEFETTIQTTTMRRQQHARQHNPQTPTRPPRRLR